MIIVGFIVVGREGIVEGGVGFGWVLGVCVY